jgi:Ser/Thr protein kinase RdoA (MazF antagonist)
VTDARAFFSLTPDRVLAAVELGGLRCTGRCMALNSLENRVYEVELEDSRDPPSSRGDARSVVVKFYRPGRWSREAILEEHAFLAELAAAEVPAVPPFDLGVGTTLPQIDGIWFAAFPKVRGRVPDEMSDDQLRRVGRFMGRMHAVGAARQAPNRPRLTVERYVHEPLEALTAGGFIPEGLVSRYREVALQIAEAAAGPLSRAATQRVHGDLHLGNLLWNADGPFFLDLDDMMTAPPVQDLWLLAPGETEDARHRRAQLLEGYEVFREIDRSTLRLCEPLRALRIIYYSAWIARRWEDPSFPRAFPTFRHDGYWSREYEELCRIREAVTAPAH